MSAPYYSAGPYNGGYNPSYAYPTGPVGPAYGGYSPNALPDLLSPNGTVYDQNIAWYNSTVAPILDGSQRTIDMVSGNAPTGGYPPAQAPPGYPPGYPPPQGPYPPPGTGEPGQGQSGGNSMLLDVGGFAAGGAAIGFFCGGGPVTAAIGAGIGAVVGGIKHFLFG